MPLFFIRQKKLEKIHQIPFANEKEIQTLTEQNLMSVFGLELVKSEMQLQNLRLDTLAFDPQTSSFVIIEYKRDKNFSVVDQGYAYLALLLNNKADFILEYNERTEKSLRKDEVDWTQSRVIFIASQFTTYQRQAIHFKDLPLTLYEATKYDHDLLAYTEVKSPETSESINTISSSDLVKTVSKEIKVYTEADHLAGIPEEILEFYETVKTRILNLGNSIEIKPTKLYLSFVAATHFAALLIQKSQIKIWLNLRVDELDDPKHATRDISNVGHWGNGDYELVLKPNDDLDYAMTLIKQAYARHK